MKLEKENGEGERDIKKERKILRENFRERKKDYLREREMEQM